MAGVLVKLVHAWSPIYKVGTVVQFTRLNCSVVCSTFLLCISQIHWPRAQPPTQQWHRQNNVHNDIADTVSRAFAALDRGKRENSIMTFWHSQASYCCCALITEAARLTDWKSICFWEFQSNVVLLNNCTFMLHIWFSQNEISRLNQLCWCEKNS